MIKLDEKYQNQVKYILKNYAPNINAWYFGSRVSGKPYKYSDIDLILERKDKKKIPTELIWNIKEAFEESDLPFMVDVVDWQSTDENFRNSVKNKKAPVES